MTHAALHLAEEFITEDLDYYFSGERDKNNQIRPDENIYSMTPFSTHLCHELNDGQVGNFFFPFKPNLLDRIYIGTSVPLFSNNWGASFLLQLLKILRPGGAVILPVYPEEQALEKGYWSRSFLEAVFLSRERWTGFSNVRAENDGVMSLQVGRKWPDPIPGAAEWFYQQRSNLVLQELLKPGAGNHIQPFYSGLVERVWSNYTHSAVVEKIILDHYGAKTPVSLHNISNDYGLLLAELLLSTHINADSGLTSGFSAANENIAGNIKSYFAPLTEKRHTVETSDIAGLGFHPESKVTCMVNVLSGLDASAREALLGRAWQPLEPGGLLIVYEDQDVNNDASGTSDLSGTLMKFGELQLYSTIVASRIEEHITISHYSSIQESRLLQEKHDQARVFRVVQKIK